MVAVNIKTLQCEMAKRKMTYSELADKSGLNKKTIANILKTGKCRMDSFGMLAEALEVEPSALIN